MWSTYFAKCCLSRNSTWLLKIELTGFWMAQSVKHLTSAQVMIPGVLGSSPVSGSLLGGGGVFFPFAPPHALALSP